MHVGQAAPANEGPRAQPGWLLWLRSGVYFGGQLVATVVFALLSLLALLLPYRTRYRVVTAWTHSMLWWLGITCGLRHVAHGIENIPARPCIILCKHQSAWETLALQEYFSPQTWVLKRELLMVPFFGWGLATLRPIAIDRKAGKSAIEQVIEQGRQRLEDGIWVVVFPEGTRTPPGHSGRYKAGGARLAAMTGYDIVPVAHNSGDFWPRNSFLKHPGTIAISIGPTIAADSGNQAALLAASERWIEAEVERLRQPYAREASSAAGARERQEQDH